METLVGDALLLADAEPAAGVDAALLARFVASRDEEAFAELVRRHAALVLGVCRRTLRDQHEAEEAFQATFMVLAAKAARVRVAGTLAPWLYGVAYRIALRAAAKRARRRESALPDDLAMIEDVLESIAERHRQRVLDDEINALPEKYRGAVVLHYLLGKSNAEVAAELGLSVRTVEGRQRRGKELLKRRLILRKASLPAALAAVAAASPAAHAGATTALVSGTVKASLGYASGISGAAAASAVQLAQSEAMAMSATFSWISASTIGCLTVGAALAVAAGGAPGGGGDAAAAGGDDLIVATTEGDAAASGDAAVEGNPFQASATSSGQPPAGRAGGREADLYTWSDAEQAIRTALKSPLKSPLEFVDMPLSEVLALLAEEYDLQIVYDRPALEEIAVDPANVTMTFQVRDVPLKSGLELALRQSGELAYLVKNDVLLITSKDVAESTMETHVYQVAEALTTTELSIDDLSMAIVEAVEPDQWMENGTGEGVVRSLGKNFLIVSQSQRVHAEIEKFLSQLSARQETAPSSQNAEVRLRR
jgi:RNA polymerase sigma factor (sigma-70 family)